MIQNFVLSHIRRHPTLPVRTPALIAGIFSFHILEKGLEFRIYFQQANVIIYCKNEDPV